MKKLYICTLLLIMFIISEKINAQPGCTASFYIDKTASTPFNAVIVNNSTSPGVVPPDSLTYKWYWNDGSSVTYGKYPTHTYTVSGPRGIRLEIRNNDSTCTDSMMLTFTIDTSGVFHKTNTNYNVKVVAPAASGIRAESLSGFAHIASGLVNDFANFVFTDIDNGKKIKADIYTYDGRNIISLNDRIENNNLRVPTSSLQSGVYIAILNVEGRSIAIKMIKQ